MDFSVSKTFRFNNASSTPKLDLFNALNSDDYTSVASTQRAAASYLQPNVVLQGRLIRVGVNVKW